MRKVVNNFMDWFERAPLIQSIWLVPVVAILYAIAFIKNKFKEIFQMATVTQQITPKVIKKKINIETITDFIAKDSFEVIAETTITVLVLGVALAVMSRVIHPVYADTIPGMYTLGMSAALAIRIVRHFDDSATNNELEERMIELEQSINERLDTIIRNMMPY